MRRSSLAGSEVVPSVLVGEPGIGASIQVDGKNRSGREVDPTKDLNRVTPEGQELGAQMVRLIQPGVDRILECKDEDTRCKTCAFRLGTVPNGCAQTQMDALKCVIEDRPFMCHQDKSHETLCGGFHAARLAIAISTGDLEWKAKCPWEFSDEDEVPVLSTSEPQA